MKKNKNIFKIVFWNIPLIIATINFFWVVTNAFSDKGILIILEEFVFLAYGIILLTIVLTDAVKNIEVLSKFNSQIKSEKTKNIFLWIDGFIPDGIKILISGIIFTYLLTLMPADIQKYYDNKMIVYLNELGSYVSAIQQKIVFEVISVSGFDFIKPHYIVMYIFDNFRDYYWLILLANVYLFFKYNQTIRRFRLMIVLNAIIFTIYMNTLPHIIASGVLLFETDSNNDYEIKVKYPLFSKFLKDEIFTIKTQLSYKKIDQIELGRVSTYKDNYEFNIIHSDELYCSLRNYNYSKSDKAQIELFDQDAGFENIHRFLTVDVTYTGFFKNMYDLVIDDKVNKILINNAYLEYEGTTLQFKKIGFNDTERSTKVYMKCKDHLYSLYYDNTEVGREIIDTVLTTGFDDLFNDPNSGPSYKYRGKNINDLNPHKCNQIKKLRESSTFKFNEDLYRNYRSKVEIPTICSDLYPFYDEENEYESKKAKSSR